MKNDIQVGDVVRLKSEHQPMTVTELWGLDPEKPVMANVIWLGTKADLLSSQIPLVALELISKP